jgi:hypothetical protein
MTVVYKLFSFSWFISWSRCSRHSFREVKRFWLLMWNACKNRNSASVEAAMKTDYVLSSGIWRRVVCWKKTSVCWWLAWLILRASRCSSETSGTSVSQVDKATELVCVAAPLLDVHSWGARTELRPDRKISWATFRGLRRSLQANAGIVPRLGHGRFLPNLFQFIFHVP